ncbi:MAG: hypothetical protein WBP42_12540 [Candidatus Zixiibacteriota bacterium]
MSDQDDLQKMISDYQNATQGLPPSIKPIDCVKMDITLGAFTELISRSAIRGAQVAIDQCISLLVSNPIIIHQPAPYARRALESAVYEEMKRAGIWVSTLSTPAQAPQRPSEAEG